MVIDGVNGCLFGRKCTIFLAYKKLSLQKFGILLPSAITSHKTILPKTTAKVRFWEYYSSILVMKIGKFGNYEFDNLLQIFWIIGIVQIVYV